MTISLISGPTPTALTDAFANPTASAIYSLGGVWNGTTWDRAVEATGDAMSATGMPAIASMVYNGTSFERSRSANAASNTSGTGLPGVGELGWDGTNWQRMGGIVGDSGQNARIVAGSRKEVSFTTTTVQAVASTDVSNYRWVSVHITGQGTNSIITFQGSNDNANWMNAALIPLTGTPTVSTATTATGIIFHGPMSYRYFRLNVTGISAGTTAGVIEFFAVPPAPNVISAGSQVAPADAAASATTLAAWSQNAVFNGTTWDRMKSATAATGTAGTGLLGAAVLSYDNANSVFRNIWAANTDGAASGNNQLSVGTMLFNGSTYDRPRTPNIFKTVTATASGNTAVWTPTTGKKFRLMGFFLQVTGNAATSGGAVIDVTFQDATTAMGFGLSSFVPSAAATTFAADNDTSWVWLQNGVLSAAANNVLNVNLSAALTAGKVRVIAVGTEE